MDAIESAVWNLVEKHFHPSDIRVRDGQLMLRECPFCHGGKHHEEFTFAIGLHNGAYNCMRARECNKRGSFKELLEHFGEKNEDELGFERLKRKAQQVQKKYDKPNKDELKPITDEIISFFGTRRISEQTLREWKIAADSHGNIVFPFYRNDELVFIKYRVPKAMSIQMLEYEEKIAELPKEEADKIRKPMKEWAAKNAEPILFGMDMVSFNKPLVITEGEIDALSVYEAGYTNVVSVPQGCNNLEWVELCYSWLENFNQIILFGDADEPGQDMVSTLTSRLGEDRCMTPSEYPEMVFNGKSTNKLCKDANEILYCYGGDFLKSMIESCEPAPVRGVLDIASIPFVDPSTIPRIMTRIPKLDHAIGGLSEGGLTVFSGKRGEGKSTISGSLLLNAVEQGYSVCAYSGELSSYKFLEWILLQATESKYIEYKTDIRSGKNICCVSPEIQKRIKSWLSGKFFLYDNACVKESKQEDAVIDVFEACARRYGCKLFLVDNLMSILSSADEENKAQARLTARLKAFAAKYKAHVLLVAHPRKEKADSVFTNDTVSGSSAITNLADNVISVEKPHLRITKNRDFGVVGLIECAFNPANRRIYQQSTGDRTIYSWDHNGITEPENKACSLEEFQIQAPKIAALPA